MHILRSFFSKFSRQLKPYYSVLLLSWQNGLVYRTSLVVWRVRQLLSTILALTIWSVVYESGTQAFGYTRDGMLSYIFLVSILQSIILATMMHNLASRVYSGEITHLLLKPINFYFYTFVIDLADKLKNFVFIVIEALILWYLYQPTVTLPSLSHFFLCIGWILGGILLYFFISLMFGAIGFWSPDTWGPKFLFFMILDFTAGKLFPLDILPETFQKILFFTPFPYLSFMQIQLFLERVPSTELLLQTGILVFWIGVTGVAAVALWKTGLRNYTAAGQ